MSTEGGGQRRRTEMLDSQSRSPGGLLPEGGGSGAGGRRHSLAERSSALPSDAPLLDIADVASYLRLTVAAVRKLLDGRPNASDGRLGEMLRDWLVRVSPHRRYIKRRPFMAWLQSLASEPSLGGEPGPGQGSVGLPSPWKDTVK